MQPKLIVLKLFAEALGGTADIGNLQSRIDFQKMVYLGQLSGVDLGYRHSWYVRGPYSTSLTRDYYALAEAVELGDNDFEGKILNTQVLGKLEAIRPLLEPPANSGIKKSHWLELLASWHYLRKISRQDKESATKTIQEAKPHLFEHIGVADAALKGRGLLEAG